MSGRRDRQTRTSWDVSRGEGTHLLRGVSLLWVALLWVTLLWVALGRVAALLRRVSLLGRVAALAGGLLLLVVRLRGRLGLCTSVVVLSAHPVLSLPCRAGVGTAVVSYSRHPSRAGDGREGEGKGRKGRKGRRADDRPRETPAESRVLDSESGRATVLARARSR